MLCCLNPDCPSPINPDTNQYCQSCSAPLTTLLRGHYRVTKVLSDEGGFGKTYLAEDVDKLNERCVVKQLAPKVQGTWALNKAIELFKEEAKRLQELGRHSQIPTLLAYFEQDNYLYLVQEFIEGQNLFRELQQRASFNEAQIRELFMYVLPVLSFIHEHGVIHRDIKPQNIMRRSLQYTTFRSTPLTSTSGIHKRGSDIVLIDFGASKQLTATVQTKPGTTIGSFGYSPIEQINGGEAYPASDLFSLGATCFHLLTGISPFQLWTEYGYSWVSSWRHHLRYSVSNELGEVLDKLLKKDINQRYQSAEEVQRDLDIGTTSSTSNGQIPLPSLSINNQRRFSSQRSSKPSPIAQFLAKFASIRLAFEQNTKIAKSLLIGSAVLVVSLTGTQIYGYMRYKIFPTAPTFLISSLPSSAFLQETIPAHSGYVMSVAISPDRKTLASGSTDKTIKLWSLDGEELRVLRGHNQSVMKVAFSSDGKTLVSGSTDKTAKLWNVETGQEIRTFAGHGDAISDLTFSPDRKTLATSSADKTIKVWNIATGEELRTLRGHISRVTSVAFSPDGKVIAAGSNDKTIKLWNVSTGEEFRTFKGHKDTVTQIAFSPDGNQIASGSSDRNIKIWNVSNGKEYRMLQGHTDTVWSVAFSFDSTMLASASSDTMIKLWNPFTGEEIRTLQGHNSRVWSVAFTTDGKTLVSGSEDGTIKIWRITP